MRAPPILQEFCTAAVEAPPITKELVAWLEAIYPDRVPPATASNREVAIAMGRAEVTRHIRDVFELQQESEQEIL